MGGVGLLPQVAKELGACVCQMSCTHFQEMSPLPHPAYGCNPAGREGPWLCPGCC